MTFDQLSKGKKVVMEGESKKKATEADAHRIAQKVLHSHEEIIGFNDEDREGLMESMGASMEKSASSFEHAGLLAVNLKAALIDEEEKMSDDEKKASAGKDGTSHGSGGKKKDNPVKEEKAAKKQRFFSVSHIAQAQTSLRAKCQQHREEGHALVTEVADKLKKYASLEGEASKLFKVARAWLTCARLVLEGDSRALRTHLLRLTLKSSNPEEAAPMERYQELATIAAVQDKASLFEICETQEQLKATWLEVNPTFQRWRELFQACKQNMASIKAINKGRKSGQKEKSKEENAKKKVKKQAEKLEMASFPESLFTSSSHPACVKDVPAFYAKDLAASSALLSRSPFGAALAAGPVVIKEVPWSKEISKTTSIHKLDLDDFKCVFAGSATRQKQGHALRVKKEPCHSACCVWKCTH